MENQNEKNKKRAEQRSPNKNDVKDDVIGGSPAGGVAGTGGVSTNDVGVSTTNKSPRVVR